MYAAQTPEVIVIQRLNAHRNPGYAALRKGAKASCFDGSGVSLKRDFQIVGRGPGLAHMFQNLGNNVGIHQAWRAAPKEY